MKVLGSLQVHNCRLQWLPESTNRFSDEFENQNLEIKNKGFGLTISQEYSIKFKILNFFCPV